MGIGDWGLGIGDWGLGPIPNPQSPYLIKDQFYNYINFKNIIIIFIYFNVIFLYTICSQK